MKLKSFLTTAALFLTMLALFVAAGTTAATAQTYTDLHNFLCTPDGCSPFGILAQGRDGNLYGTTYAGVDGYGVVFRITPGGTLKVLHAFDFSDGSYPYGGLTLGTNGVFYGTTYEGGTYNWGTIFKMTRSGTLTTLSSFAPAGDDGGLPWAPLIQGTDGNFYGTTEWIGNAYKITPSGTFTYLAVLPGISYAALLQATDGHFYGTTYVGGTANYGTVFRMTRAGTVTTLYNFDNTHGANPTAALIQGPAGNFYGTTWSGGTSNGGVVFKLTPQGALTVLHNFVPNSTGDGSNPFAGLVLATDGNFYGVTAGGGTMYNGVIFQVTPAGAYSVIYNFDGTHGAASKSTPTQHTNGKLYGLTTAGGTYDAGAVYSLDLGLAPFVSLVSTLGTVGKTIEILGQGFTGTTAVSINGSAATFTVVSDTYLTATVPVGATTGFVTVTTPGGKLTSNQQFRVRP